jgi:competence protein ComEA
MKKFFAFLTVFTVLLIMIGPLWADDAEKININTASAEELETLVKIGPKYAERIIEYREKNGPFEKPKDIMQVSGIGPKTFELNKHRIVVE